MCLKVNKAMTDQVKARSEIIAYKILNRSEDGIRSPIRKDSFWTDGVNQSSRTSAELDEEEISDGLVFGGFHCCLDVDSAEELLGLLFLITKNPDLPLKIYKVKIDPKDVVAAGCLEDATSHNVYMNITEIVATKVTLIEKE